MISYAQIYIFLRKMGGYFLGFEFSRWVMLEGSGFMQVRGYHKNQNPPTIRWGGFG